MHLLRLLALVPALALLSAEAAPVRVMFERDADVADNELVFRSYASFDDMADNLPSGPDRVSPINISGVFSTTGLTWDGQQYVVMFERDADVADNELVFRTYADFDDLVHNLPSGPDRVSPINISGVFSTTGLAFEWTADPPPQPVPEPASLSLAGLALLLAAAARMRWTRSKLLHIG